MLSTVRLKLHRHIGVNHPKIGVIIAIALILRSSLVIASSVATESFQSAYSYDTPTYLSPAEEWLRTGFYNNHGVPELFRTPGYPVFLLPGILFGHVELVTLVLQILLSTLSVYLTYKIIQTMGFSSNIALWGAFLLAIDPATILYTGKLLSETVYTFFLLLFTYSLAQYINNQNVLRLLISSFILAGSIYIRPIGYFIPFTLFLVILMKNLVLKKKNLGVIIPYKHLIYFLVVTQVLLGFWHARNYFRAGYAGFSTVEGINLYFFYGASIEAAKRQIPLYDLQNQMGYRDLDIYFRLHPEQLTWSKGQIQKFQKDQGIKTILNNLPIFIPIYAFGIARTLLDPCGNEFLRIFSAYNLPPGIIGAFIDQDLSKKITKIIELLMNNPHVVGINLIFGLLLSIYYILSLIGIAERSTWLNKYSIILISLGFYLILLSGGPVGVDRMRVPVMPIICIFSSLGFNKLIEVKWRTDKNVHLLDNPNQFSATGQLH